MAYKRRRRRRPYNPIRRARNAAKWTGNLGHGPFRQFKAAWRQLSR